MKKIALLILTISVFAACKQDDKTPLLIGKWQGKTWTVGGKDAGRDAPSVKFEFNTDGTYATAWGEQGEKGSFRLDGDKLYTTADAANKIEKMVKLSTLTADTMIMDMNRMGDAEQLTLIKAK